MLIAFAIFLFTLVLVIWQPRGLGIGWSASIGALLALALGSVAPGDIPTVWNIVWNATATFIAVIVISLLLDEAGFFEWAALHVARWAGGDGRRLFAFCVLLGAAVSALFANDGAALILTPIVMSMLLALRFSPAATLAFVMAAGFIADSASLPLVVSNLVNIVSADYFGLGFGEYAAVMLPVNLVSVATSLLVLFLYFRRDLPPVYALEQLKPPRAAIRDRATFVVGGWMLLVLLAGLFALEPLGVPVSAVAAACAALLLAVALAAILGSSLWIVAAVIAMVNWVQIARVVYTETTALSQRDYIEAARALGAGTPRILLRHLAPHLLPTVLVYATLGIATTVLLEAMLSFLGVGVRPPEPSWGGIIFESQSYFLNAPWLVFFPGLAIVLVALSFNLVGDALRDALDPTQRGR